MNIHATLRTSRTASYRHVAFENFARHFHRVSRNRNTRTLELSSSHRVELSLYTFATASNSHFHSTLKAVLFFHVFLFLLFATASRVASSLSGQVLQLFQGFYLSLNRTQAGFDFGQAVGFTVSHRAGFLLNGGLQGRQLAEQASTLFFQCFNFIHGFFVFVL